MEQKQAVDLFFPFERQLIQTISLHSNTANRKVFRNVCGTRKFIKETLFDKNGMYTENSFRKLCQVFSFIYFLHRLHKDVSLINI